MKLVEKFRQVAEAFEIIATANHYLVGFVGGATLEQLEMAKQYLIIKANAKDNKDETLERALDLIEVEIRGARL